MPWTEHGRKTLLDIGARSLKLGSAGYIDKMFEDLGLSTKPAPQPVTDPTDADPYELGRLAGRRDWQAGGYNSHPLVDDTDDDYAREYARGYNVGWR